MDRNSLAAQFMPAFVYPIMGNGDYERAAEKAFKAADALLAEASKKPNVTIDEHQTDWITPSYVPEPTINLDNFQKGLQRQYVGLDRDTKSFTIPRSAIIRELDKHIIPQEETNGVEHNTIDPKSDGQGPAN